MFERSRALVCLSVICGIIVFAGCGRDSAPATTAPPPSEEASPPPTPTDQDPKFLTRTDRAGERIIAGVCKLPDIAGEIIESGSEYRLDLDRSFVVSGTANGVDVEITYLTMPSLRSPGGELKYIINVQTQDARISGAIIATDRPTPGALEVDGVWLSPQPLGQGRERKPAEPGRPVRPGRPDQRWSADSWYDFIDCMAESAAADFVTCLITCSWWGAGVPACTTVCFTIQTMASAAQCVVRVSLAHGVRHAEPVTFP